MLDSLFHLSVGPVEPLQSPSPILVLAVPQYVGFKCAKDYSLEPAGCSLLHACVEGNVIEPFFLHPGKHVKDDGLHSAYKPQTTFNSTKLLYD